MSYPLISNEIWNDHDIARAHRVSSISLFVAFGIVSLGKFYVWTIFEPSFTTTTSSSLMNIEGSNRDMTGCPAFLLRKRDSPSQFYPPVLNSFQLGSF